MIVHIFKLIWNKRKSNALIMVEIFLSFLILFAALTFIFKLMDMYFTPLGFETKDRWMILQDYTRDSTELATNNEILYRELMDLPRVKSVAFGNSAAPFSGYTSQTTNDDLGFEVEYKHVGMDENYAETMGLKIIDGRWFTEEDAVSTHTPILITQSFKDRFFKDKPLVDSVLILGDPQGFKILGIVEEYKYEGEFEEQYPKFFFYNSKTHERARNIYLEMDPGTPASYEEKVNQVLVNVTKSPANIIQNLETKRQESSKETWVPVIAVSVICLFLCLNIALGLFGVLWYSISRRRGEIGLRSAIGAYKAQISRQFVLEIVIVAVVGILGGMFFAFQFPLMKIFPIDNRFYYYAIFVAAVFLLLLVISCALYPSLQAAKVNPADALHED